MLVYIGEMAVTAHWLITPAGTVPLRGTQFIVRENVSSQRRIPAWAIVLAIIFAIFCLLGLLFLLIQEDVVSGTVEVTAATPDGFTFQTSVPVGTRSDRGAVDEVRGRVDFARRLVMRLQ